MEDLNGFMFSFDERKGIGQMAQFVPLIAKAARLKRAEVRRTVERFWSLERMAANYESVYRKQQIMAKSGSGERAAEKEHFLGTLETQRSVETIAA